jgi:hypothetical protein
MVESPRRLDLRLTIPAAAPYHAVASELAARFAEYSGADAAAAKRLASAVQSLTGGLVDGAADGSISLTMEVRERELVVTAQSGARKERATCPLPA